jgi:hypothetical protein
MVIPLTADDSKLFYENIRNQYFKIITSENISEKQKKEFYSLIGETVKYYKKSKENIPVLKKFSESLVENEESKLKIIEIYSNANKNIQENAEKIRKNQKSLDKNLKEIKKGIEYKQNLENKSRDELIKGNFKKN